VPACLHREFGAGREHHRDVVLATLVVGRLHEPIDEALGVVGIVVDDARHGR
jgi:hypothetical protein